MKLAGLLLLALHFAGGACSCDTHVRLRLLLLRPLLLPLLLLLLSLLATNEKTSTVLLGREHVKKKEYLVELCLFSSMDADCVCLEIWEHSLL